MNYITCYVELKIPSQNGVSFVDITNDVNQIINESGLRDGTVTILSKHTTAGN